MNRKYCAVPKCFNSNVKTPEMVFFSIPRNPTIRKKWMTAMRRDDSLGTKTVAFCCEDHFDMDKDMDNYVKHNLVGERLKLKKEVVPHRFACQNRLFKIVEKPESHAVKLERLKSRLSATDYLSEYDTAISHDIEEVFIVNPSTQVKVEIEIDPLEYAGNDTTGDSSKSTKKHKTIQVNIKTKVNHKSTQTDSKYFSMPSENEPKVTKKRKNRPSSKKKNIIIKRRKEKL